MTDDSRTIWKTCLDLGWQPERLQGWRVPESLNLSGRDVAIYGEPLFAEAVTDQLGLSLLEPPIDWLLGVPQCFSHRQVQIMTLNEARALASPAFVKPADGKIFDPKVYANGSELPTDEHVDGDIQVLRSEVVEFQLEVRCIIRDGRLVTLSPYWRDGSLAQAGDGTWPFFSNEETEARAFANQVLGDGRTELPPACTLDVGRLKDGRWAIIEANPVWGAGLYGCDPVEVLRAIRRAIVPTSQVDGDLRRWISKRKAASA